MANNFDVPRRRSLSEFRGRQSSLCGRKSVSDVVVVGRFMKCDKKLAGNVETAVAVDKGKKPVSSYLDLYRRKFVNRNKTRVEKSSRRSCEDSTSCETLATLLPRDEQRTVELDLYYRSRGSRETRSAAGEREYERAAAEIRNNRDDFDDVSKCDSESFQPVNRRRRVFYKSYRSIEDRKRGPASGPQQPDRSLVGSERNAIEHKGEWLMRRRSYGDSVSARNRQRILRRAQQLENSRRADAQKAALSPLTDSQQPPEPTLKVHPRSRNVADGSKKKTRRRKSREEKMHENPNDLLDEDSIQLKILRQRHLEEKRRIDDVLLLKRRA